ncbi:hypothetical protein HOY80DRAFT_988444 [Tuber brumale]|nr:hypothetical protein HOY80DRAFT_988444 [Tuber brumale]
MSSAVGTPTIQNRFPLLTLNRLIEHYGNSIHSTVLVQLAPHLCIYPFWGASGPLRIRDTSSPAPSPLVMFAKQSVREQFSGWLPSMQLSAGADCSFFFFSFRAGRAYHLNPLASSDLVPAIIHHLLQSSIPPLIMTRSLNLDPLSRGPISLLAFLTHSLRSFEGSTTLAGRESSFVYDSSIEDIILYTPDLGTKNHEYFCILN